MNFKCLNVKIDNLSQEEILNRVKNALNQKNQDKTFLQINTVNPEFILEAQKNQKFRDILNAKTSLNIADGIGLKFASWRYGKNLKCRWAGVDLMGEILKIADKNKQRVFLIANKKGLIACQEVAEVIEKIYPNLEIKGVNVAVERNTKDLRFKIYDLENNIISLYSLKSYILNHKSDVLFCALGAPQQEILLHNLQDTGIKLAMGVGGSFDFLTGKIKRAPKWMRIIGLEWFWRLILEPRYRLKRIYNAVMVFPIRVIVNKENIKY